MLANIMFVASIVMFVLVIKEVRSYFKEVGE
jgi:hypothetical protein